MIKVSIHTGSHAACEVKFCESPSTAGTSYTTCQVSHVTRVPFCGLPPSRLPPVCHSLRGHPGPGGGRHGGAGEGRHRPALLRPEQHPAAGAGRGGQHAAGHEGRGRRAGRDGDADQEVCLAGVGQFRRAGKRDEGTGLPQGNLFAPRKETLGTIGAKRSTLERAAKIWLALERSWAFFLLGSRSF